MLKFLLGIALGLLLGWGLLGTVMPRGNTQTRVNEAWRKIQPGMSLAEVDAALGKSASYESTPGQGGGGPDAAKVFPKEYWKDHGCRTYMIEGMGPYLLFVAYDRDGRVTFVSCGPT